MPAVRRWGLPLLLCVVGGCVTTQPVAPDKPAGDPKPPPAVNAETDPKADPPAVNERPPQAVPRIDPTPPIADPVKPAPDPRLTADERLVLVAGRAVSRNEIIRILMETYGSKVVDVMVEYELAKQLAAESQAPVSDADREKFVIDNLLIRMNEAGLTGINRDQAIEIAKRMVLKRGESWHTYEMEVWRLYYLDRISRSKITVTDEDLKREFEREYGEKLNLRVIAVNNHADAAALAERVRKGDDFARLAKDVSQDSYTANRGGVCDPVGRNALPKAVEDEVFRLKDGDLSRPVNCFGKFCVFQLISRIPPQNARFEQVREEVRKSVTENKVRLGMQELLRELKTRKRTSVVYYNESLRPEEK